MVKEVRIVMDNEDHAKVRELINKRGWTWNSFIKKSYEAWLNKWDKKKKQ